MCVYKAADYRETQQDMQVHLILRQSVIKDTDTAYPVSYTHLVLSVTYVVCFALMRLRMPIMIFGIMTIVFCVLYSIAVSYTHLDVYKRQCEGKNVIGYDELGGLKIAYVLGEKTA